MGSSGGGGGGGSNDWPDYMKTTHSLWLNDGGKDKVKYSVTALMSRAMGASPYASFQAIDPAKYFGTPNFTVFQLVETYKGLDLTKLWEQTQSSLLNSSVMVNSIKSHSDFLNDELEERTLPEFKAGMRNINAVMSTAFVVGEGLIRGTVIKALSRYASELQLKLIDIAQGVFATRVNWQKDIVVQATEVSRIALAANLDASKYNSETLAKDKLWDLRTYEYGVQVMAAISGGIAANTPAETSAVANALGGAMSGGAAGSVIGSAIGGAGSSGGAYGAAIGAAVGLGMSFSK